MVCSGCATNPRGLFSEERLPPIPEYSDLQHWAAHPSKADSADLVPNASLIDGQDSAAVDVFFLHPTTYTRRNGNRDWNGPIQDMELKERTNKFPIKFQATVFNGTARVFAPYYRQAHIYVYYTKKNMESARKALNLAYRDVETAFQHYMEFENQGRPFIIASHSQGTTHAVRLIREYVDGKPIQKQLVAAYLIGMPVKKEAFQYIMPCENEMETNCYCSWQTWQRGHQPKIKIDTFGDLLVTNPLTWQTSGYGEKKMNKGSLLRDFNKMYAPGLVDAEVHKNVLWVRKPKFPWSFLFRMRNYHVADYNFFWMNMRENAAFRSRQFLTKRGS